MLRCFITRWARFPTEPIVYSMSFLACLPNLNRGDQDTRDTTHRGIKKFEEEVRERFYLTIRSAETWGGA